MSCFVMTSSSLVSSGVPLAMWRTRSRSVNIPTSFSPCTMGMLPMLCSAIVFTASRIVLSGEV